LQFCYVVVSLCATGNKNPFFPSLQRKLESHLLWRSHWLAYGLHDAGEVYTFIPCFAKKGRILRSGKWGKCKTNSATL